MQPGSSLAHNVTRAWMPLLERALTFIHRHVACPALPTPPAWHLVPSSLAGASAPGSALVAVSVTELVIQDIQAKGSSSELLSTWKWGCPTDPRQVIHAHWLGWAGLGWESGNGREAGLGGREEVGRED